MDKTKVLLLSSEFSRFELIAPALEGVGIEVHRMMSGEAVLKLTERVPFKVILVADPLDDVSYIDLLKAIRSEGSLCRSSGVIIMLPQQAMADKSKLFDRGANRVLELGREGSELRNAMSELLGVAIRAKVRTMMHIELLIGPNKRRIMCQTENLSQTGFLIRGNTQPIGTQFDFELKLPGQLRPIRGTAEVVRHASWVRERMEGFGARFLSLSGDAAQQIAAYLKIQGD
jgi:CheY-like chemotaxis protein